ncbi:MAG: response regulator, partial [Acidobacteriota bacterium]
HNTYEAAFAQLLEAYRHLDALSICVQLLPDALLDQEKISLLSQRQACSVLLEKIDALEQARQDAENAERAKATLLACLTYELHDPVHAMIDLGRSLRDGEDSGGKRARLDALLATGEDLLRRVEDLAEASGGPPGRRESAAEPAPLSPAGPASAGPDRPGRAPSVLVVDDHPVNCQVARVQLERLGYASAEVDGGRRALDALDGRRFDVVLLDVHMPALDGFETCRRIRADPGRYGRPKILMMSPRLSESDRRRCRDLGADGAVAKPVSLHDLKAALRRLADAPRDGAALDVDRPRLQSRRTMLSEERWREVLGSFVDTGGKMLAKMHRAASASDGATVRRLARKMRTTSVSMGAARIAQICADVEASCEAGAVEEVGPRLEQLEDAWAAFRASTRVPPLT